jgi:hypothetical protein
MVGSGGGFGGSLLIVLLVQAEFAPEPQSVRVIECGVSVFE